MGIAFIIVFTLSALLLLKRALKFRQGKAVPLAFSSFLLAFQLFQVLSFTVSSQFFFGVAEHFVLSSMIVGATIHQFSSSRSMQYI